MCWNVQLSLSLQSACTTEVVTFKVFNWIWVLWHKSVLKEHSVMTPVSDLYSSSTQLCVFQKRCNMTVFVREMVHKTQSSYICCLYLYTSQHATYELQLKPAQNQIPQMKYHNYVSFKASKYFKMEHQQYTSHSSLVDRSLPWPSLFLEVSDLPVMLLCCTNNLPRVPKLTWADRVVLWLNWNLFLYLKICLVFLPSI